MDGIEESQFGETCRKIIIAKLEKKKQKTKIACSTNRENSGNDLKAFVIAAFEIALNDTLD